MQNAAIVPRLMLANPRFLFQNRDMGGWEFTAQFDGGSEANNTAADDDDARSGTHIAFDGPKIQPSRVNSATKSAFAYGYGSR